MLQIDQADNSLGGDVGIGAMGKRPPTYCGISDSGCARCILQFARRYETYVRSVARALSARREMRNAGGLRGRHDVARTASKPRYTKCKSIAPDVTRKTSFIARLFAAPMSQSIVRGEQGCARRKKRKISDRPNSGYFQTAWPGIRSRAPCPQGKPIGPNLPHTYLVNCPW